MSTTWRALPVLSIASINELRTAVYEAGGSPATWTDEQTLPADATLKSVYVTEIRDAIQRLWDARGLGLIPNWTTGAEPTEPAPGVPPPLQSSDITDLRTWFNHFESWGDLRGVHWFDSSRHDITSIFWNVESVVGVTKDNAYHSELVSRVHGYCQTARNRGLVNIVRIDWQEGIAVPTTLIEYVDWARHFKRAVNALKDVATIFIVGNEPNEEGAISGYEYARAYNYLYRYGRIAGAKYLAAGPALFKAIGSGADQENDVEWIEHASNTISDNNLDGWALHTYGGPYLDYAGLGKDANELCDTATVECPIKHDDFIDEDSPLHDESDAGFRRYRDFIDKIRGKWGTRPVYITETNTQGYKANYFDPRRAEDDTVKGPPSVLYVSGWNQSTYQEIRNYNGEHNSGAERNNWPRVLCLCWFVDANQNGNWPDHALSNTDKEKLVQARADFIASDTSTGLASSNPTSDLAPSTRTVEHRAGHRSLVGTIV